MEASPEEIVSIPTEVLSKLMKKVRKQSREIKNLRRVLDKHNEIIRSHNRAWDEIYERVAEMGDEIINLTESMSYGGNQDEEVQQTQTEETVPLFEGDLLDVLSDAMTDDQIYRDYFDTAS